MTEKTALSYWFPKLEAAGLPVPRTMIVPVPNDAQEDMWDAFDGKEGNGALKRFCDELRIHATGMGLPCFLRTDHTSNKHDWKRTCFVADASTIARHVYSLAEFSECCGMIGLPWQTMVLREFLPTIPFGVCPRYGDMPICKEFRFFVDGPKVRCAHPYWPLSALQDGGADPALDYGALCRMDDELALSALAAAAGEAVGGAWSVDILETRRGWFITDMAEAHESFHWEGCPNGASP